MSRTPTSLSPSNANIICALGDSLTYNNSLGVPPNLFYPHQVAELLNAAGANVRDRNFGRSGDSTGMAWARIGFCTYREIPQLAVLFLGTNDLNAGKFGTVQASPAPTTTSCSVTAGVGQYMPAGTYIQVNGISVQVATQVADALTWANPITLPVVGQQVNCDTQAALIAMVNWFKALSASMKVLVVGHHYQNYSAGSYDTITTQNPTLATLRGLQSAAAAACGVPYVDMYAFMKARIVAGTDVQGSFSWHVLDQNVHLNAYGQSILAQAIVATIQAQAGWIAALSS